MDGPLDLEQAKHVFEAVMLTVLVDGDPDDAEAVAVGRMRAEVPAIAALEDIGDIGRALRDRYLHIGMESCARAIANGIYDRPYRELAFVLCAKAMLADGETDLEEAELLGLFQELFGFDAGDVKALLARARG